MDQRMPGPKRRHRGERYDRLGATEPETSAGVRVCNLNNMRIATFYGTPRADLLTLPEDVLEVIVGHLPLPSLMAVRLVCRLLRSVSARVITSLNLFGHDLIQKGPVVAQKLQALPGLTRLCFSELASELETLIRDYPDCTPMLREISIDCGPKCVPSSAQALCAFTALAPELTSLTRLRCSAPAEQLPFVVASCPRQLAWLELPDNHNCHAFPALPEATQQLTALQTLRIGCFQRELWDDLLPRLTSLPHLRDLAEVPVYHQAMAVSVAAITSLTSLHVQPSVGLLDPLTELPALEALRVRHWRSRRPGGMSFEWLPHGMSQLTELAVFDDCTFTGFKPAVASLGRLASLHLLTWHTCTAGTLLEAPLQGLQNLSVNLGEGSPVEFRTLCAALTRLESLSITVRHASARELFQRLPQLTRLTSLRIEAEVHHMERVPATFLSGLTGLAELKLCRVLSRYNPEADIACLALLTRLQCLELRSDGEEKRPRSGEPEPKPPAVEPKHLQPLSALRWLEVWDLNDAWRVPRGRGRKPNDVVKGLCAYPAYSKYELESNKFWKHSRYARSMSRPPDLWTPF